MISFDEAFARLRDVPGWLTEEQARVLYDAASTVRPGGTAVEIGSHHGRSAIALAGGLPAGSRLIAVDPFPAGWRYGAAGTESACRANLRAAGVEELVDLRVQTSEQVRRSWPRDPIDVLYIDGKHDMLSVLDDLKWSDHVRPEGLVLVHDAYSSAGVTAGLLFALMRRGDLTYAARVGSLATLRRRPPTLTDRVRALGGLGWFGRNLVVKALLRLRLHRLAAALGHRGTDDPY